MASSLNFDSKFESRVKSLLEAAEIPYIIPSRESIKSKYLHVPSIGLDVVRERSLFNHNFQESQDSLHSEKSKILTPYEFTEFLKEAKTNAQEVYQEITEIKNPWRAEWLDAKFEMKGEDMYVNYHAFDSNGNIVEKTEILDKETLMKNKSPGISIDSWLENPTAQGLPKKSTKDGSLYYWNPRDGKVAGFLVNGNRANLFCNWNPSNQGDNLGVRAAKQRE